jgi:hypothetical protein
MSTSLLYHAFAVRGYRYVKTECVKGGVIFAISKYISNDLAEYLKTENSQACHRKHFNPQKLLLVLHYRHN